MAGRSWEEDYERNQSRLRDSPPCCEHRNTDGTRCRCAGGYKYVGYFPDLTAGLLCDEHRRQQEMMLLRGDGNDLSV